VKQDFEQIGWSERVADDCRAIVRLAVREDLDRLYDLTTVALVPADRRGKAVMVSRQPGVASGLEAVPVVLDEMEVDATWNAAFRDGDRIEEGTCLGRLEGSIRDLLTAERQVLNIVCRLSGIATTASTYLQAVRHTGVRLYDTRKTTPGWRRLDKYAARCGGAYNHRTGLFDAILIKDNHLAAEPVKGQQPIGWAIQRAREFCRQQPELAGRHPMIEVEVDTLQQFDQALAAEPDLILLDNMAPAELREAVRRRQVAESPIQLEASGGISLETVRAVAETGVDRISVGALTHAAPWLDVGLDWQA
jgi:nicotinate-nucleotide pyrophosphorylase (carboxylating)